MRLVREPGHLCQTLAFPRPSGRGSIAAPCRRASTRTPSASFPRPSGRGSIAAMRNGVVSQRPPLLPPAIRPGLHCGKDIIQATKAGAGAFPRPSGQGSIAARTSSRQRRQEQEPSPGHQAGAPLRRVGPVGVHPRRELFPRPSGRGSIAAPTSSTTTRRGIGLPLAIRPGLHCGSFALVIELQLVRLPPAIRPGLHCGYFPELTDNGTPPPSPGHQAGAPLRHDAFEPTLQRRHHSIPRPSGRGSIAARIPRGSRRRSRCRFPRPSGRGSIAATRSTTPSYGAPPTSPGHQAGAPLRQIHVERATS